jgi:hypothetical protein
MTMNQYAQDARGPCRVLLTGHQWPDLKVERAVFETAGLQLVAGPVEAGSASEIEALVREHDPAAILTCWATVSEVAVAAPTGLKIVARLGVGLDNIAMDATTARGAWVTNVPDYWSKRSRPMPSPCCWRISAVSWRSTARTSASVGGQRRPAFAGSAN